MRKFINDPSLFVEETIDGIVRAFGDKVGLLGSDNRILLSKFPKKKEKVGIVTAGGSGHLPLFLVMLGKECMTVAL